MLHPYYKLQYIEKKWGGEAEQQAEIAAGNADAINWVEHARDVVDTAVSYHFIPTSRKLTSINRWSITGPCASGGQPT